jgi:hypothetical protein
MHGTILYGQSLFALEGVGIMLQFAVKKSYNIKPEIMVFKIPRDYKLLGGNNQVGSFSFIDPLRRMPELF